MQDGYVWYRRPLAFAARTPPGRQSQHRPRPRAVGTILDLNAALVQSGSLAHETQSEAGTLPACAGPMERIEAIEETRKRVVGNAGAFVFHGDLRIVCCRTRTPR